MSVESSLPAPCRLVPAQGRHELVQLPVIKAAHVHSVGWGKVCAGLRVHQPLQVLGQPARVLVVLGDLQCVREPLMCLRVQVNKQVLHMPVHAPLWSFICMHNLSAKVGSRFAAHLVHVLGSWQKGGRIKLCAERNVFCSVQKV